MATLILILFFAISLIVFLILKIKLHAAISLIIATIFVGFATKMDVVTIISSIESGVGGTLGFLALIIGFGSTLGKMLEMSGGSETLASSILNKLGKKNATWVMMLVGFLAGIPVFCEVGFFLLVPIVYVIARDAGLSKLQVGLPLGLSLMVVHCLLPPHPAATAITVLLNANIGKVILLGLIVAFPCAVIGGPLFIKLFYKNKLVNYTKQSAVVNNKKNPLPSFWNTLFTILLPLLLMVSNVVISDILPNNSILLSIFNFFGNPIIALLIAVFYAYWSLGLSKGKNFSEILSCTEGSFNSIGSILLIIGAGGAFNKILINSGIGDGLIEALSKLPVSPLILAWIIAGILRFSVGSATIAMISTAGIMAPILVINPSISPEIMVLAIGTGSLAWTQVTDSLFWVIKEYLDLSLTETFKSFTVASTIASIVGLLMVLILNSFI